LCGGFQKAVQAVKKIFSIFLFLIFLATLTGTAAAAEKVVQLNIPGCST
jgi:hypothetical protein